MKKTFLKFLPIAAAVLLATSCSKDNDSDNSVVPTPVETQNFASPSVLSPTESNAVPFSIKVVTGKSLSKIGYTDNGIVTPAFTTDDVNNGLKMTISNGTTPIGTLTLKDADGTFEGTLSPEPADGTELTATIVTNEGSTIATSTVSIIDLMERCAHTYTGEFTYGTDDNVMLTDDKAYIEIIMSPLQHDIDLKFNDDDTPQNFPMENGSVWIAVDNNTTFTTNFTGKKNCTAGKITTIKRTGLVDLGISDGTLWADANTTGGSGTNTSEGWYYTFDKANGLNGETSPVSGHLTVPTGGDSYAHGDFQNLFEECYWVWDDTKKGYNVFKSKDASDKKTEYGSSETYDASSDTHIFLPAAGIISNGSPNKVGESGFYWSSNKTYQGSPYGLTFNNLNEVRPTTQPYYLLECAVRAVRHRSNYSSGEGQGGGED